MSNFPGFDTGSYPGDNVMNKWFGNPYVFTGRPLATTPPSSYHGQVT